MATHFLKLLKPAGGPGGESRMGVDSPAARGIYRVGDGIQLRDRGREMWS